MDEFPHPITSKFGRDILSKDYTLITCSHTPDRLWHCQVAIRKTAQYRPAGSRVPGHDKIQPLVHITNTGPAYALEIAGQCAKSEVNACDYLDAWIEAQSKTSPITLVSKKSFMNAGGRTGDAVITGEQNNIKWAGRVVCLKYGPRFVILSFRCALADYAKLAEEFFVSLMSFQMLNESPGVLAENLRWVSGSTPVRWKIGVPMSCEVKSEVGGEDHFSEFHGDVITQNGNGPISVGNLTTTIVAADHVPDSQSAKEMVLGAIRESGVESAEFVEESAPVLKCWSLEAPARVNGGPGELRVRLLQHPKAWICAVLTGPTREANLDAWMRNKRLLDVLAMMTEIG